MGEFVSVIKDMFSWSVESGVMMTLAIAITVNILLSIVKPLVNGKMSATARKSIFPLVAMVFAYLGTYFAHKHAPQPSVLLQGLISGALSVGFYTLGYKRFEKVVSVAVKGFLKNKFGASDEDFNK